MKSFKDMLEDSKKQFDPFKEGAKAAETVIKKGNLGKYLPSNPYGKPKLQPNATLWMNGWNSVVPDKWKIGSVK